MCLATGRTSARSPSETAAPICAGSVLSSSAADTASADTDWRRFLTGLEAQEAVAEVPTPAGFVGELSVAGNQVGRGYAGKIFRRQAQSLGFGPQLQPLGLARGSSKASFMLVL